MTGEVTNDINWKQMLKGVDGIVFVADSQPERMAANQASLGSLRTVAQTGAGVFDSFKAISRLVQKTSP